MKKYFFLIFVLLFLVSCLNDKKKSTLSQESKEQIQEQSSEANAEPKEISQEAVLDGSLYGDFVMELKVEGESVEGEDYWLLNPEDGKLKLTGTLESDGHLELVQFNYEKRVIGHFDGYYGKKTGYNGIYADTKGEKTPFSMSVKKVRDLAGDGDGRGFLAELPKGSLASNISDEEERSPEPNTSDEILKSAARMPTFPNGDAALNSFINKNLRYPRTAKENGVQGKVLVQFVVEKDGHVGEVKIARGIDTDLDNEAVRVCKMLPRFNPGLNADGTPVRVWYTLPVYFKL